MAFTEEEKQEILEVVKAESKSVESLETVGSLSGVKSLPAQKGDKLVSVPTVSYTHLTLPTILLV